MARTTWSKMVTSSNDGSVSERQFTKRRLGRLERLRRRRWLWLLVAGGMLWWGGLWYQLDRSVLTRVPILDEAFYLERGAEIAAGQILPVQPFIMSPLYPYLVAWTGSGREFTASGARQGPPPRGLRLLQLAGWVGILWLLWHVGRRLGLGRLAVGPPLLFALYQPAAIFTTATLLEVPLSFAVTSYLFLLTGPYSIPPRRVTAVLSGVLLGTAALLRTSSLVLLAPMWLAWGGQPSRRRRAALLTAVVLAVLLPVSLWNSHLAGRACGVSCNGGLNLYIGNGPEATGFYVVFAGFDFQEDPAGVGFLSARLGRQVTGVAEADRIWGQAAWDRIRRDPGRAVMLWLKKVWLHFVGWEIAQVTPLDAWRRDGPLLRLLIVPYALISTAGLFGALMAGRRDPRWRLWAFALLVLVAGQSLFFVVSRYRMVLVPLLCLLAAAGVQVLLSWRGWRLALGLGLAAGLLLAIQPWGLGQVRAQWDAIGDCNLAARWQKLSAAGALSEAERFYRAARDRDPTLLVAYRGLARVLADQDRQTEAAQVLAEGILRVAQPEFIQRDLINLLLAADSLHEALPRMAAFLAEYPRDADMLHNYTVALARSGRLDAALAAAQNLMAQAPDDPRGYVDLGILLARSGQKDAAREVFAAGLQRHPANQELRHNLEVLDTDRRLPE